MNLPINLIVMIKYCTRAVFVLSLVFLVSNCSKDESPTPKPDAQPDPKEPETEVYFTLNVLGPRDFGATDEWIIIHDQNGKLLDFKQYTVGDVLKFEANTDSLTEKIAITELKYIFNADSGSKFHSLVTTPQVLKGSEWSFGSDQESTFVPPVETGAFQLSVTNIPGMLKLNVSTKRSRLYTSPYAFPPHNLENFSMNFKTYEGEDDYIISILDASNNIKYYDFGNPDMSDISVDYSQFKSFDHYINVNLPPHNDYYLNVAAFEDDDPFWNFGGYWLHDILGPLDTEISTTPLVFGYLDSFTRYRTTFVLQMEGYDYNIAQYGERLEELTIPDKPSLSIIDPSRNTFKFEVDIDYISANHGWNHNEGSNETNDYTSTGWGFFSEKGVDPIIGDLPDEILEKYPTMGIDKLEYSSTRLNLPIEQSEYFSSHGITIYNQ